MADAIRQIGVSEVTYYRWRQEFGWAEDRANEAPEGPRTREQPAGGKVVSDLTLDKLILRIGGTIRYQLAQDRAALEQSLAVVEDDLSHALVERTSRDSSSSANTAPLAKRLINCIRVSLQRSGPPWSIAI
jgi:hypothetical protein